MRIIDVVGSLFSPGSYPQSFLFIYYIYKCLYPQSCIWNNVIHMQLDCVILSLESVLAVEHFVFGFWFCFEIVGLHILASCACLTFVLSFLRFSRKEKKFSFSDIVIMCQFVIFVHI